MNMLKIGGFTPLTTTDYPGQIAAVVFCQGCPWHCGYCHNAHLIPANSPTQITWPDIRGFLKKRQGLLDAVVFSGGEPTLQNALKSALEETRQLGFKTGLHTAGMYPERLAQILPLVDWVGMDIKAPFAKYEHITGVAHSGDNARVSAQLLINSGVKHEFRTTWNPQLLTSTEIEILADELLSLGATHYAIQAVRTTNNGVFQLDNTPTITPALLCTTSTLLAPKFIQFSTR